MLSILGFLLILGPLVIFHELGHFLIARFFNVKAEVFSIGFGPKIWSKQMGETEVCVSAIPLGGYVKLMGDEGDTSKLTPEELARALPRQAAWKRFFIFLGGPLFNFILAVIVFMAILVIGEPQVASVVGRVVEGSYAESVGFKSGDKITEINHVGIKKFDEMATIVSENPEKPLDIKLVRTSRDGVSREIDLTVTPKSESGISMYGEVTPVGQIDGLFPSARTSTIGVSSPKSAAARAGVQTGDHVVRVNGQDINDWETLRALYQSWSVGTEMRFRVERGEKDAKKSIEFVWIKPKNAVTLGADFGLYSSELFVDKTISKSPAEAAGIQVGDRIVSVGTHEVKSFFELRDQVQDQGANSGRVQVKWERDGKLVSADISPTATTKRDILLKKTTQFTVGVVPMLIWQEPVTFIERVWNPFVLLYRGTERMVIFSWRNVVSLKKMVTGDVSLATLGGPILIGKLAGESISRGLISFLTTMAILSVGLGVLNILPIPVLDGGHLMLLGIEVIRRKPLTMRQMEVIQQVGLSLILLLMAVVIKNDLTRLPFFE